MNIAIEDPWEAMVYRALTRAAEAGHMCPTCDDIADLIGANAVATTVGVIQRLEKRGLIAVERYQRSRRVTIVATGRQTAEPKGRVRHWREQDLMAPINLGGVIARANRIGHRVWVNIRFEGDLFDRGGDGFDGRGMTRRQLAHAIGEKVRKMDEQALALSGRSATEEAR